MSSNPADELAKQLAAEAERQRLEAEAKAAEPAQTPEVSASLEKLTRILTEAKPAPLPDRQPAGGADGAAENKKPH